MKIIKINTQNKRDIRDFIRFPFNLYKDYPNWVPPMINDVKLALNRTRHPFYKHSNADFFLAKDGRRVLGRIAAIDNQRYKEYTQEKVGFFYFFEVVNDIQVARRLFDTVFSWSLERGFNRGERGGRRDKGILKHNLRWTWACGAVAADSPSDGDRARAER